MTIKLGRKQEKIEVTSGIRQGCSIFTLLFKMVTFNIIEELETRGRKHEVDRYSGNSLWIADNVTLIAGKKEDLETNINILRNTTKEYGLEINRDKSKVIQIRGTESPRYIGGFEVVNQIKYLGVIVGGRGRDIFRYERV